MATEIITTEDLKAFGVQLLQDFKNLLNDYNDTPRKKWLKSFEVMTILNITKNTLKTYRINRILYAKKLEEYITMRIRKYKNYYKGSKEIKI